MGITAAVDEITAGERAAEERRHELQNRLLPRLDSLIGELEELNVQEIPSVPRPLQLRIIAAVGGLRDCKPSALARPVAALGLVFAAESELLRRSHPEFHEVDDEEKEPGLAVA